MNARTHAELVNFIWGICNLLRGPYKRNEYRKVILPITVLRRFDCVLAETKDKVLAADASYRGGSPNVRQGLLEDASGRPFYNTSKLNFERLLNDPSEIAQNLSRYIRDFSDNVFDIMQRFGFDEHIARMERTKPALSGHPALRPSRPLARARRQRADGIRVRGANPHRCRASERGGGRTFHTARGDPADGQPLALA